MTRLALVCRTDQGGLAAQTQALWQFLKPDRVLLLDLPPHKRRGDSQIHRFAALPEVAAIVCTDVLDPGILLPFTETVDTLITVECLYAPNSVWRDVNDRCTTVLVANPELYADYPAHHIIVPTTWNVGRVPGAEVIPHPVDLEAVAHRRAVRSGPVRTFLHVQAPAMLDRNGSELVAEALPHVEEPCTLIVRSHSPTRGLFPADQVGKVRVVWDNSRPVDPLDGLHPSDTDVLLLPRRYGGLSMVVQEAASLGIPTVMLNVDPQAGEGWPGWRIPAYVWRRSLMRGGEFEVHAGRPAELAATMTAMVRGEVDVEAESVRALTWAEARSWPAVEPQWTTALT